MMGAPKWTKCSHDRSTAPWHVSMKQRFLKHSTTTVLTVVPLALRSSRRLMCRRYSVEHKVHILVHAAPFRDTTGRARSKDDLRRFPTRSARKHIDVGD